MHLSAQNTFFIALLALGCGSQQHVDQARQMQSKPPRAVLTLTYLGAAGYQLESGRTLLLADPYFSRPQDFEQELVSDREAIAMRAPSHAELILVGHSHADHVLDVPSIALRTNAQVMGTASTARLARAGGVRDDHIIAVRGGEDYAFGNYSVRVLPSLHSALDHKHTFGAELAADIALPMRFADYAEGGTLAYLIRLGGHQILFLSTANFIESELRGLAPDVAIVATGLRQEIHDYTCRLLRALGFPAWVFANHFDDWRAPPADAPASADLLAFVEEVRACSPGSRVVIPRHFVRSQIR